MPIATTVQTTFNPSPRELIMNDSSPDYKKAIAAKIEAFDEVQLREVLFAVNAIAAGVETTNSIALSIYDENQRLKDKIKSLQQGGGKLHCDNALVGFRSGLR